MKDATETAIRAWQLAIFAAVESIRRLADTALGEAADKGTRDSIRGIQQSLVEASGKANVVLADYRRSQGQDPYASSDRSGIGWSR